MEPTIGRIVHFVPDEFTRKALAGNHLTMGEQYDTHVAAVIVRVWNHGCVNLKVLGDGPHDVWVTSAGFDESPTPQPRTWHWPPRA